MGNGKLISDNSQLKKGYKLTELGVIPEDWEIKKLGGIVTITSGESPSKFKFISHGIPYYKVDQLNSGNKYQKETPYYIESNSCISKGSIIFPKRGASILLNKVRILSENSFMDTNLMTLTISNELDNEYLYYILLHTQLWRIADTTSIPQINNKHINPLQIPLPPTKAEQTAIAEALSDVDALISSLEALIAKKRNIKQGAMQQLLTGKTRLPRFSGKWEEKELGDIAPLQRGFDLPTSQLKKGNYPVVYSNGIGNYHSNFLVQAPGVVTGRSGTLGKVTYLTNDYWPHNTALWVTDFNENYPLFIYYLYIGIKLERFGTGSPLQTHLEHRKI